MNLTRQALTTLLLIFSAFFLIAAMITGDNTTLIISVIFSCTALNIGAKDL